MSAVEQPTGTASGSLASLAARLGERDGLSLGEAVEGLGQAGIGMTLLLLSLPALIPLPGPFGIVFGLLVAFVSAQLMFGARRLWLPSIVRNRMLPASMVKALIDRGVPILRRAEAWLKPRRLLPVTGRIGRMALGAPLILMGLAVALPIPLGNVPPVASLIALALGLTVRDGGAIILGLILAGFSVVWFVVLYLFGAEIFSFLWSLLGW